MWNYQTLLMGLTNLSTNEGKEQWRDQPLGKEFNQCLRYWRGQLDYSIPPITPRMVSEPNMQTVGGTLKPLQCTRRRYPKGTFTPQQLEPRARYIKLSLLPWKGTQDITPKEKRDNRAFLIIPYLFHNLVLTLALEVLWQAPHRWSLTPEGVSLIIQVSELEVESPWVFITRQTKLRFISLAPSVRIVL